MQTKNTIRLMVVDDHASFRRGLISLIESEPGMSVVAQTGDGTEAVDLYRRFKPDVALVDLRLPGISGVQIGPGATVFTRMPFSAASTAKPFVKFTIAPLVAA